MVAVAGLEPNGIGDRSRKRVHLRERIAVIPTVASAIPIASSVIGNSGLMLYRPNRHARMISTTLRAKYAMILVVFILTP